MKGQSRTTRVAECLMRLGTARVEAELVACLLENSPVATKDILELTGLRQPEVSVGMRILRERGWTASEPIPREGKGRPMHRYSLQVPQGDVYAHYEHAANEQIQSFQEAIQDLAKQLPAQSSLVDPVGTSDESGVAQT